MSTSCRVARDEINNDLSSIKTTKAFNDTRSILRLEVINTGLAIVEGKPTYVQRFGQPYVFNDLMEDLQNHKLYPQALLAMFFGDRLPLSDLMSRCVNRAVAVSWYGESDADDLGFVK